MPDSFLLRKFIGVVFPLGTLVLFLLYKEIVIVSSIKVSVIVAAYNAEHFLKEAMDSLVSQTLREIEIICVDDDSTDKTYQIFQNYAMTDSRVKVVHIKHEGEGAAHARNVGLSMAQGEYVSILDADDFFEPDMLKKTYNKAKECDVDIVCFNAWEYDNIRKADRCLSIYLRTEFLPDKDVFRPEEYADTLFFLTCGAAWNSLFRVSMLREHSIDFFGVNHADDLVFTYLAFACCKKMTVLNERLLHYRFNVNTSQTARKSLWPESGYRASLCLKEKLIQKGKYEVYKVGYVRRAMDYALFYLETMDNIDTYHKLFFDLKNEYLDKLGVYDIPDELYHDEHVIRKRELIKNATPEEFLFQYRKCELIPVSYNDILRGMTYMEVIPENSRVVLYGAGLLGSCVFTNFVFDKRREICAWVDKNYNKIGFPVQPPDVIKNIEFDICFVAIEDYDIFETVKKSLGTLGIPEEKVWWLMKGREDQYFQDRKRMKN